MIFNEITKNEIYNSFLFKLQNFLKENEIKIILNKAKDWKKSVICGHLSIFEDNLLLHEIWKRIQNYLPSFIKTNSQFIIGDNWELIGLCEKIRILKYEPGEYIDNHSDKVITRNILDMNGVKYTQKSFFSIYIYLNDDYCGGEYYFWELDNKSEKYNFVIKPKKGDCVILHQSIINKKCQTFDNTQYILRLDIIYQKKDKIIKNCNYNPFIGEWE